MASLFRAASRAPPTHDVVIVGGGMVGSALACALGATKITSKLRVAVIEAASTPSLSSAQGSQLPPSLRVSAINNSSARLFKDVGIWEDITGTNRLCAFTRMVVYDSSRKKLQFEASEMGEECLGYFMENNSITSSLSKRMQECANIDFYCPAKVREIKRSSDEQGYPELTLEDGNCLTARLLVTL